RGCDREDRGEPEEPADRRPRAELLLGEELPDVRQRLDQPERADAVGAVAVLVAAEDLALGQQDDRHELQADREDHDRLEDLHPPRLVVADGRERGGGHQALRTSTSGPSSANAESSGMATSRKTVPSGVAAR